MDSFDLKLWKGFYQAGGTFASTIIDQIAIDSRRIHSKNSLFVALPGENYDGHQFILDAEIRGAKFALVSKSYHPPKPLQLLLLHVDHPLRAFQEIAACYRAFLATPIIAITGSLGKTMLKDLLYTLLSEHKKISASPESFNSQIGVPLSLLQITKEHELAIIEAGISKPGEMDFLSEMIQPDNAILTTIGSAHLSTLQSEENIAKEKTKLLEATPASGWVLAPSHPAFIPLAALRAKTFFWDRNEEGLPRFHSSCNQQTSSLTYQIYFPDGQIYEGACRMETPYLVDLIQIAVKAAWLQGSSSEVISKGLKSYFPEPMQTEIWTAPFGATFINDAYCADPLSVALALKNFRDLPEGGKKIFIFGGLRGGTSNPEADASQLAEIIEGARIDRLLLVKHAQSTPLLDKIKLNLSTKLSGFHIEECHSYASAIDEVRRSLRQSDVVLIQGPHKQHLDHLSCELGDLMGDNRLTIDLSAIENNLQRIREQLPLKHRLMVMVKAQGYGTDSIILTRFLKRFEIDIVGAAHVDEGVALRRAGISQDIFIIHSPIYEVKKVIEWRLEVGVSDSTLIDALEMEAARAGKQVKVHLHIDTGMSRLGCRPEEALTLAKQILNSPHLKLEGLMTHFASADMPEEDLFTKQQADIFEKVIAQLNSEGIDPPWKHAANSSGVLRGFFPSGNMVRIGLALFGLSPAPLPDTILTPAITLTSRLAGVNHCKEGDTISYGRTFQITRPKARIGVIPLGYFDGLHRRYSGKGYLLVRGQKAPLVGTICMDYFMVDLSDIPEAAIGDPVLIFGKNGFGDLIPPAEFAARAQASVYELITCLGPRIQRIFVYNGH